MGDAMIRVVLLALGIALASLQSGVAEEIKIGVLLPLTGPSSDGGRDMQHGFEIATEMQNEKGGIHGDKINLIMADAVDVKTGRSEAERLIQSQGVKIIMGTYVSAIAFAATEVAERNHTFYWEVTRSLTPSQSAAFAIRSGRA
jgi:branched-chain amino acid transport system substrate-binding protein